MKEMQLFEVGFKERFQHSGYFEKFYVAAKDAEEAEKKARNWIEGNNTYDGDGDSEEAELYAELLTSLKLARMYHVDTVVI